VLHPISPTTTSNHNHTYANPGNYFVVLLLMNLDGLQTIDSQVITVKTGTGTTQPINASITNVFFTVVATGDSRGAGNYAFIIDAAETVDLNNLTDDAPFNTLGGYQVTSINNPPYLNFTIEYPWFPYTPISVIKITCRATNNYLYATGGLQIANVTFTTFASNGQVAQNQTLNFTNVILFNDDTNTTQDITPDSQGNYFVPCARRGNVYEDAGVDLYFFVQKITSESSVSNPSEMPGYKELLLEGKPHSFSCVVGCPSSVGSSTGVETDEHSETSGTSEIILSLALVFGMLLLTFTFFK